MGIRQEQFYGYPFNIIAIFIIEWGIENKTFSTFCSSIDGKWDSGGCFGLQN